MRQYVVGKGKVHPQCSDKTSLISCMIIYLYEMESWTKIQRPMTYSRSVFLLFDRDVFELDCSFVNKSLIGPTGLIEISRRYVLLEGILRIIDTTNVCSPLSDFEKSATRLQDLVRCLLLRYSMSGFTYITFTSSTSSQTYMMQILLFTTLDNCLYRHVML